jgi:hypothetical protein
MIRTFVQGLLRRSECVIHKSLARFNSRFGVRFSCSTGKEKKEVYVSEHLALVL